MLWNTIDTVFWLINNVRYVIAAGLVLSMTLFTLGTWYILTRFISFRPILCIFRPFSSAKTNSTRKSTSSRSRTIAAANAGATRKTGAVKRESSASTATASIAGARRATRSSTAVALRRKKSLYGGGSIVVSEGLAILRTVVTASLSIAVVGSICVCAFSLTASGCNVLRQLGLIEWLPWKEGLKCYRTKWDWIAEIFGELVLQVLRHPELNAHVGSGSGSGSGLGSGLGFGLGNLSGLSGLAAGLANR